MKTIIIYTTKHGATGEIAQKIADKIGGALIHNLGDGAAPSLAEFDCVIIGSSLYAGGINRQMKAFLKQNSNVLQEKKTGLFVSGLEPSEEKKYFESNFPTDILKSAKATSFLGGIFDPQKASAMERMMLKAVAKLSDYTNTIDDEKIKEFAETIKA